MASLLTGVGAGDATAYIYIFFGGGGGSREVCPKDNCVQLPGDLYLTHSSSPSEMSRNVGNKYIVDPICLDWCTKSSNSGSNKLLMIFSIPVIE